jgi:hypothetical protein
MTDREIDLPPLPWRVAEKWDERTNGCLILDANGQPIASVLYRGGTGVPRMTAERIVECAAILADRAARDKDAERYRWLRQYLAVGRDEPKDWTCWIELPCIPYRSRTTKAEELLDALIARFPLGGPDDPHVCDAAMEKDK